MARQNPQQHRNTAATPPQHRRNTSRRRAAAALRHGRRAFGGQSPPQWLGVVRSRSAEPNRRANRSPRAGAAGIRARGRRERRGLENKRKRRSNNEEEPSTRGRGAQRTGAGARRQRTQKTNIIFFFAARCSLKGCISPFALFIIWAPRRPYYKMCIKKGRRSFRRQKRKYKKKNNIFLRVRNG